ncbi:MAG TPA: hypothetical protein VFC69_03460 [Dysgonamonadaceae bacterium]|nr:hypothetical protein [Dysgonamonadaceae bacterium]
MSKRVQQFDNFVWIDLENPTEDEIKSTSFPFDIDENFIEDSLELGHLPKEHPIICLLYLEHTLPLMVTK